MKKLSVLFLIALFTLTACNGKTDKTEQKESEKPLVTSFNIVNGLGVYAKTETAKDDGTKAASLERDRSVYLTVGEAITATGEKVVFEDKDYVGIKTEAGKEFFIRDIYFNPNGKLGVITSEDAVIYSKPNNLNPTAEKLPRMGIVVFSSDEDENFYRITALNSEERLKWNVYLKKEVLSPREADVQSALLYYVAGLRKTNVEKEELLKTAINEYGTSVFIQDIRNAYDALSGEGDAETSDIASEKISFTAVVNDNNVSVRGFPDTEAAKVVSLTMGTEVEVVAKTVDRDTIDGVSDVWYKISEPDGWIFGTYLDPK
ncbi:MAG: SH3 domain-containing protein [Spirochaetales bacterium]|nr:SH3 domain-containing protein [Spirochaetales bacterium]